MSNMIFFLQITNADSNKGVFKWIANSLGIVRELQGLIVNLSQYIILFLFVFYIINYMFKELHKGESTLPFDVYKNAIILPFLILGYPYILVGFGYFEGFILTNLNTGLGGSTSVLEVMTLLTDQLFDMVSNIRRPETKAGIEATESQVDNNSLFFGNDIHFVDYMGYYIRKGILFVIMLLILFLFLFTYLYFFIAYLIREILLHLSGAFAISFSVLNIYKNNFNNWLTNYLTLIFERVGLLLLISINAKFLISFLVAIRNENFTREVLGISSTEDSNSFVSFLLEIFMYVLLLMFQMLFIRIVNGDLMRQFATFVLSGGEKGFNFGKGESGAGAASGGKMVGGLAKRMPSATASMVSKGKAAVTGGVSLLSKMFK